ncbi:hypothetical protein BO94DRAFT_534439 [Aspergillus sclerotioniger CBS 115572]|uniref:SnoaL-like domain-containing protein n=1 Tax=Aspergillus sclerotioniger CBS 115572 TaxID=1450535 RepID=A0A317WTG3_9EURO|nr:hypothetical protein BO94DRAFT_534439 [Aspergillus sclerotioniger CBS 115572]PWY89693.1 hypothetical protein BO94DRAFT_534439 [Aspergillus sclerotioniger CBS 115572]
MHFFTIITAVTSVSLAAAQSNEYTALGCPNTTKPEATPVEQLAAWDDFTNLMYTEKRITDAFAKYAAASYINHSPLVTTNGINETMGELSQIVPNVNSQLQHAFVGWDRNGTTFGTAHTKVDGDEAMGISDSALVDIIRMVGTCLVEHYDVQQSIDGTAPNPIAFF